MKNLNVMFMGTPEIAVGCLEAMHKNYNVCCVVTQPDKPSGRGKKMNMPDVKKKALEFNLPILQPTSLRHGELEEALKEYKPDVIVVIAYGQILPQYVLDFPKMGCINVHASLLPKYRGAAPIQHCIIDGEKISGITTMLMDKGLDTGDILLKREVEITPEMTGGELHDLYCEIAPDLLTETLEKFDEITPEKQDDEKSTYAERFTNENTRINWDDTPENIINFVRGLNPYPVAHTTMGGKKLKVYAVTDDKNAKGIKVGPLTITELQAEGKKRMKAADFMLGNEIGNIK